MDFPIEGFTYQMDTPIKWTHLSNGRTYQMDSPVGLDLKPANWALETPYSRDAPGTILVARVTRFGGS